MSSWALKKLEQKFSTDKHKLCRKINPSLKKIKQQVIKFTTRFSVLLRVKLLTPIHRKSSRKSLHVSQKNPQTLVSHFIFTRSPLEMKNPKFKRLHLLNICHFYQKYEGERGEWKSYLKAQHYKNSDYDIQSHHFMANRRGKVKAVTDFIFSGSKIPFLLTSQLCFSTNKKKILIKWCDVDFSSIKVTEGWCQGKRDQPIRSRWGNEICSWLAHRPFTALDSFSFYPQSFSQVQKIPTTAWRHGIYIDFEAEQGLLEIAMGKILKTGGRGCLTDRYKQFWARVVVFTHGLWRRLSKFKS